MPRLNVLGVGVDSVNLGQATAIVVGWLGGKGKHIVVTPNVEFIIAARKDKEFQEILQKADLSISDSNRLDWAHKMEREKNFFKRLYLWPFFLYPNALKKDLPTVTGVDLMESICKAISNRPFAVGLLGGREGVAERAAECLRERYPGLKISFAKSGGRVNSMGESLDSKVQLPKADIVFVALGQVKQEKWIDKNFASIDAKVLMGVGGALDYLSGEVPRAPKRMRDLGFEWLFRLIVQPWRIKRFIALLQFLILVVVC